MRLEVEVLKGPDVEVTVEDGVLIVQHQPARSLVEPVRERARSMQANVTCSSPRARMFGSGR